ncbi:MAG TPA: nuclear transport factor 2 family protein [Gemmatimonadales bacterium]|nr:nuclear transport factor 2 family protein [Gemmatimonadales bacterium]
MFRFRRAAIGLCLIGLAACRIEDHTPTGSRRDDDAIQHLLVAYTHGLSTRDWPALRDLFWKGATYEVATADGPEVLGIDSARSAVLPRWDPAAGPPSDVRILRADTRQEGDLAAVWLVSRERVPRADRMVESDRVEHLVMRRIGTEWRILSVALATGARRRS